MGDDDYSQDDYSQDDKSIFYSFDDDEFEDYSETAKDLGPWFTIVTVLSAVLVMALFLPATVYCVKKRRKEEKNAAKTSAEADIKYSDSYIKMDDSDSVSNASSNRGKREEKPTCATVMRYDLETRRILRYAIPFTLSSVSSALMNTAVLAIIGHYCGTKQLAAIAVLEILLQFCAEFMEGPIESLTALCAHAIGSSNFFLAGQYVQLSVIIYLVLQVPFVAFWFFKTSDLILFLGWGDEVVAAYAQGYARIAIWYYIFEAIEHSLMHLMEVAGHELFSVSMEFFKDLGIVVTLVILVAAGVDLHINMAGFVFVGFSAVFLILSVTLAWRNGWLEAFKEGIFQKPALKNRAAISNMWKTAPHLAMGSVVTEAEWFVLAMFAAHIGGAEVAAWAIVGSIWETFESATEGIGDAAEIRIARHLGNNSPQKAKRSAYKSLMLGMVLATVLSGLSVVVMDDIPAYFTYNMVLQRLIGECLPLIIPGNLLLTFGTLCWYMVGAQGRFKLATWVAWFSSWTVTIPLSALFVYYWGLNLTAMTGSVVIGYVVLSAALSFVLLTTDWAARADKIIKRNALEEDEEEDGSSSVPDAEKYSIEKDKALEQTYALLASRSHRSTLAKHVATGRVEMFTCKGSRGMGLSVSLGKRNRKVIVTNVAPSSPFKKDLYPGDEILSIDQVPVAGMTAAQLKKVLNQKVSGLARRTIAAKTTSPQRGQQDVNVASCLSHEVSLCGAISLAAEDDGILEMGDVGNNGTRVLV